MPIERRHQSLRLDTETRADLTRRGLLAWLTSGGDSTGPAGKPVQARMAEKAGPVAGYPLHFVIVHAGAVVLAVYRVQQTGSSLMLRRMVRPPKDLVRLKG